MNNEAIFIMGVNGDVSLVLHTKLFLQASLICYCMMENNTKEVK